MGQGGCRGRGLIRRDWEMNGREMMWKKQRINKKKKINNFSSITPRGWNDKWFTLVISTQEDTSKPSITFYVLRLVLQPILWLILEVLWASAKNIYSTPVRWNSLQTAIKSNWSVLLLLLCVCVRVCEKEREKETWKHAWVWQQTHQSAYVEVRRQPSEPSGLSSLLPPWDPAKEFQ